MARGKLFREWEDKILLQMDEENATATQMTRRLAALGSPRTVQGVIGRLKRLKADARGGMPVDLAGPMSTQKADAWNDANPAPKSYEQLSDGAKAAFDDFETFMRVYVGPELPKFDELGLPAFWVEMAHEMSSGEHEYLLINIGPGFGKTTAVLAYILWRLVQNRNLKVVYVSASHDQAKRAIRWLQHQFTKNEKLIRDFGRFYNPSETWTSSEFVIDGADQLTKEASVKAYGMEQEILGTRVELIIVDDPQNSKNSDTADKREQIVTKFENEIETRLEPGGVLAVVQQRLGPHDLSGYLAEIRDVDDKPAYHRIRFRAHDESNCPGDGTHPDYPEGCLLWSKRWSYTYLMNRKKRNPGRFDLLYQQEDVAAADVLVRKQWIEGNQTDPETGELLRGCLDHTRHKRHLPSASPPFTSVVTVDPSPTRFWAVMWWMVDRNSDWHLMEMIRRPMSPIELLHGDEHGPWDGILEDIAQAAAKLGHPLRFVIVEANAAQRWLLQLPYAQAWASARMLGLLPHHTHAKNKGDPELGPWGLGPRFRHGKVRLPYDCHECREMVDPLIREVTTYPHGQTDDCVMSTWFLLWNEESCTPELQEETFAGWGVGAPIAPPPHLHLVERITA